MGFGKTTVAKELEQKLPAVRFTIDEMTSQLYSKELPDNKYREAYKRVDALIWQLAEQVIKTGTDVVFDYGFWSKEVRKKVYNKAKAITPDVVFHQVTCDIKTARQRLEAQALIDDENLEFQNTRFDINLALYEPIDPSEGYEVIVHKS